MKNLFLVSSLITLFFLMSCSSNTEPVENNSSAEDEAAIKLLLEEDSLVYTELDDGSDEDAWGDEGANWEAQPLQKSNGYRAHYGRRITSREKTIEVVLTSDTTATAYVHRLFEGKFVSLMGNKTSDTSFTVERFEKPLVHEVDRVVKLFKFRNDTSTSVNRRNWKVESVSLADGYSTNNTVSIVEIIISAEGQDDVVITNPTEFFLNGVNMFTFPRHKEVTVTVKVNNGSANPIVYPVGAGTEQVKLHYGRNRKFKNHHGKKMFTFVETDADGNNVYQGTWTIKQFRGAHHAIVDVIDNGTIFNNDDEAYPYNASSWGTPYRVTVF